MKKTLMFITIILLISCSTDKKEKKVLISDLNINTAITEIKKDNDIEQIQIDSIKIPTFEIQVELTKRAEKKLLKEKETVIVKAFYRGIPKDKTNKDFIEYGELLIETAEIELIGGERIARFDEIQINRETFNELENGEINVLINIFSGRKSSLYSLLDCDILQKSIDSLKGKRNIVKGKLIY